MAAHAAAAPNRVTGFENLLASTGQSAAKEAASAPPGPLDWGLALGISTADFAARAFTCDAASLKNVRCFIRETVSEWDLGSLADDLTTVVNELTSNAVLHALVAGAGSKAWVGMARAGDTVVCAVADPSPAPPSRRRPAHLADSGRGLLIVDALCDKWGYAASEASGKTVWARICLTDSVK